MRRMTLWLVAWTATVATVHGEIPIHAVRIATGLQNPLFVTSAPGDPNRIYIVEQRGAGAAGTGDIRIFDLTANTLSPTPFLSVPNLSTGSEQGLLGLAFSPDYASPTSGKLYVDLTNSSGTTELRRYTRMNANAADPNSAANLLTISQPQANHNGGWLGFGPNDGDLYIGSGDGGGADDQDPGHTPNLGNGQDKTTLLGKMLRIDVSSPPDAGLNYKIPTGNPFATATDSTRKEIWAYGLRNPWRNSFDRANGNFYIGDTGQSTREEIDFQSAGSTGGENYGWRAVEGDVIRRSGEVPTPRVDPIHTYVNPTVGQAVVGGYVYRGAENDALVGSYIFGDYGNGRIWSFKYDGTTKTDFQELTNGGGLILDPGQAINNISSFGEDAAGNLYVTDIADGELYRLVPALTGDADLNNVVNAHDLGQLALHWQQFGGATWADGDFTNDGNVDMSDLYALSLHWLGSRASLAAALATDGLPASVVPEPAVITFVLLLPAVLLISRPIRVSCARQEANDDRSRTCGMAGERSAGGGEMVWRESRVSRFAQAG